MRLPPDQLRSLQIVAGGLIAGPVLVLGVALYLRRLGPLASVEAVTYLAAAAVPLATMVAWFPRADAS